MCSNQLPQGTVRHEAGQEVGQIPKYWASEMHSTPRDPELLLSQKERGAQVPRRADTQAA